MITVISQNSIRKRCSDYENRQAFVLRLNSYFTWMFLVFSDWKRKGMVVITSRDDGYQNGHISVYKSHRYGLDMATKYKENKTKTTGTQGIKWALNKLK